MTTPGFCKACDQYMRDVERCVNTFVWYADGEKLLAIPYSNPYFSPFDDLDHRCHDCGVALGRIHHPGCDLEECPRCHGQLLSCECDVVGYHYNRRIFRGDEKVPKKLYIRSWREVY